MKLTNDSEGIKKMKSPKGGVKRKP